MFAYTVPPLPPPPQEERTEVNKRGVIVESKVEKRTRQRQLRSPDHFLCVCVRKRRVNSPLRWKASHTEVCVSASLSLALILPPTKCCPSLSLSSQVPASGIRPPHTPLQQKAIDYIAAGREDDLMDQILAGIFALFLPLLSKSRHSRGQTLTIREKRHKEKKTSSV